MRNKTPKRNKREMRQSMHLTRPPRMEGVVKNAKMQTKKKPKKAPTLKQKKGETKVQSEHRDAQRKDYQLRTPKPKQKQKSVAPKGKKRRSKSSR